MKKLKRNDVICGYRANTIREFLNQTFSWDDSTGTKRFDAVAEHYFNKNAKAVEAEMVARGWIIYEERNRHGEREPPVALTQLGKQSRAASFAHRIPRARGEAIVAGLIERANSINARSELLYWVTELRIFGSMLDPAADTVGDVDVMYALARKSPPEGMQWVEWNRQRAEASGRMSLSFIDEIYFGYHEVKKLLKARLAHLSLHAIDEELDTPYNTIFTFKPDPERVFKPSIGK